LPVLNAILPSNAQQLDRAFQLVADAGARQVGVLGLAFKAGTDDLRESPIAILAEALLGKGLHLRIYDRNVSLARLVGSNKQYIEDQIPHLSALLCESIDEVIDQSEVIVVGNQAPEFAKALPRCRRDQIVIDLVRLPVVGSLLAADYRGICW
jgi:GDP-mannose 6-dehydrogenase